MLQIIGQSLLLAGVSIILLRVAGRKSISQMTIPQLGILLTIGSIVGSEVSGKGLRESITAAVTFIAVLVAIEWLTLKSNTVERLLKGVAVSVIKDGNLKIDNLEKLRISVDDLEKRLRMLGITKISDVKTATIEVNGELGYELYLQAKPVTLSELETLLKSYFPQTNLTPQGGPNAQSLFSEISHPHRDVIPDRLQ